MQNTATRTRDLRSAGTAWLGRWLLLSCAFVSLPALSQQAPLELDPSCIVSILNRTVSANAEGRFAMPSVPSFMGNIRARATCVRDGQTISGQSNYFQIVTNDIADAGEFFTAGEEQVPRSLEFTVGNSSTIFGIGGTQQLIVIANYADGSTADVTTVDNGINYIPSNPQIIGITGDGLITALATGTSMITARKDGAIAVMRLSVTNVGDSDGDGLPDDFEVSVGLNPLDPIDAMEDQDRDGLSALEEFGLSTDINDADSDNDGIEDGEEVVAGADGFVTNPLLADTDGDGINDGLEILASTDPTDENSGDFGSTLAFITVQPATLQLAYNSIDGESKAQLTVTGTMLDGSEINLTSTNRGTTYETSDISVVSFGAVPGEVFAGQEGVAQITVSNAGFSFVVNAEITSFDPAPIAFINIPGEAQGVEVQGDYAYVAADAAGLLVIDITDRANPVVVGTLDTPGTAFDLKVNGNYVYLADGENGLLVIDISAPATPVVVSARDTAGSARDLDLQDGFVFVADGAGGIEIFNALDPLKPFSVSTTTALSDVVSLSVEGDVMAAVSENTLALFDISNLQAPLRVASVNIGRLEDVVIDNGYIHAVSFVAGWRVFRIGQNLTLDFVASDDSINPWEVAIADGFAFYAEQLFPNATIHVNIKDPENPVFQGVIRYSSGLRFYPSAIAADSTHVYAAGEDQFRIAQYRDLRDSNGFAPTVTLLEPADNSVAIEGSSILVSAAAADDIAIGRVELHVDQALVSVDTTYPYQFNHTLPRGQAQVGIFARAVDLGGNAADSATHVIALQPDQDDDGLGDDVETNVWFTDPVNPDTDGDGVQDGEEIARGIDPNVPDSDGDGIDDGIEVQNGTDPNNPDITPLGVSFTDPVDGAIDIAENAPIEIVFDDKLLPKSVQPDSVRLLELGVIEVEGRLQLMGDDDRLLFTPGGLLQDFTGYTVIVDGLKDEAGNPMIAPFQTAFTTGNTSDVERPRVQSVNPGNGDFDVPVNTQLSLVFSERMDPASFNSISLRLIDKVTDQDVAGVVTLENNNQIAIFTPETVLAVGRDYELQVRGNLTDLFGNFLGNPFSFTRYFFTTSFSSDSSGPVVQSTTVSEGLTDVPLNASLNVRYDEAVSSLTIGNIRLNLAGAEVLVDRTISNDHRVVTLTPRLQLAANTQYQLETGLVTDLSGNPTQQVQQIGFATGDSADVTDARSLTISPKSGMVGLPLDTIVEFISNERIDPTTITDSVVYLENISENRVRVPSRFSLDASGTRIILVPDEPLKPYRQYLAFFSASQFFYDLAGNRISGRSTLFTTADNASSAAPAVVIGNVDNAAIGVALNASLRLLFDLPLSDVCLQGNAVSLSDGVNNIEGSVSLSDDGRELVFDPAADLAASTGYSLTLTGVCGVNGQVSLASSLNFTTGAVRDTTRPVIVSITPVHQSTAIGVDTAVTLEFSETIDPLGFALNVDNQRIQVSTTAGNLAGNWAINGSTAVFTPASPLPGNTRISTQINSGSVRDQAGNIVSGVFNRFFDTESIFDTIPPAVSSISPNDGAMDIYEKTDIVITFSESLSTGDLNRNNFMVYADGQIVLPSVFRSVDNRVVTLKGSWPAGQPVAVVVTDEVQDLSGNALPDFVSLFTTAPASDIIRPRITQSFPSGTDVDPGHRVVLHASEAMNAASLVSSLKVSQNGLLIGGSAEVSGDGRIVTFSPNTPFATGALVQVDVDSTAVDNFGNALIRYQDTFRIADAAAQAGLLPRPTAYNPFNGQIDVPRNPLIQIAYNQVLNPATVTPERVQLVLLADNSVVPATLSVVDGGRRIQLVPDLPLDAATRYRISIGRDIEDIDGDVQTSNFSRVFTTAADAVVDNQSPRVLAFSPPAGATGVPLHARYHVRLDEAVNSISFASEVGMDVSFAEGNREILYSRYLPLPADTDVIESLPAVNDVAGNPALAANTSFHTGVGLDTTPPGIVSFSPASGSTIATNSLVRVEFDEAIDPVSVNANSVFVEDLDDNSVAVPGSLSVENNGRHIVWVPDAPLGVGRRFRLTADGIADFGANTASRLRVSFFTDFGSDLQAPGIVSTTVSEGQGDVPTNARIRVRFDEPINRVRTGGVRLSIGGQPLPVNVSFNADGSLLTLTPKQLLPANTAVLLAIADVEDAAANRLAVPRQIGFTTGSGLDNVEGIIEQFSPQTATENAPLNTIVEIGISERIDPTTLTATDFNLEALSDRVIVPSSISLSADGRRLVLTPDSPLSPGRQYQALAGFGEGLYDLAGNQIGRASSRFTAGPAAAIGGPAVIASNISEDTSSVALNAPLKLVFDQPLNIACVNGSTVVLGDGIGSVPASISFGIDSFELVVDPESDLAANTNYTLSINGLCDVSGQSLNGYMLSFTTAGATDLVRPFAIGMTPAHQAAGVPVSTTIAVDFSEVLDSYAFKRKVTEQRVRVFTIAGEIAGDWAVTGSTSVFTPANPLPGATRINLRLESGSIRDQVGNVNSSVFAQFFDTESVFDTTAPEIISITPNDGAMDIGRDADVVITFSESINTGDMVRDNFFLYADGQRILPSVFHSVDNRTVTLRGVWPTGQPVMVVVTSDVRDLSDNRLAYFISMFATANSADTQRPRVTRMSPATGATDVHPAHPLVIYTGEPMNEASVIAALRVSENGVLVDGNVTSGGGRAFVFTPNLPFGEGSLIEVDLDSTATDLAGNAIIRHQGGYRTYIGGATPGIRPAPSAYNPPRNRTGVPLNPEIQVLFNQSLNPATVSAATVELVRSPDNLVIPSTLGLAGGNRIIQLTPNAPLDVATQYTLFLRSGIADIDGDSTPSQGYSARFTTAASAILDNQSPGILALSPPDGSDNVPLNPRYQVVFDEAVNSISFAGDAGMDISISSDNRELSYSRSEPLPADTDIIENLPAIADVAGNPALPASTSFRTGADLDTVSPTIDFFHPLSSQVVPTNTEVRVKLSEPINPLSLTDSSFVIEDNAGQPVAGTTSLQNDGQTIVWVPDGALAADLRHRISITSLTDLSGNAGAFLSRFFNTGPDSDLTAPQVLVTSVAEGQTDVPTNARIRIRFDEPINRYLVSAATLSVGGVELPVNTSVNSDGSLLTLTPVQLLPANNAVLLTVADVEDLGRNRLATPLTVGFVTGSRVDITAGIFESISPPSSMIDAPLDTIIEFRTSEQIDPATLAADVVYLLNLSQSSAVVPTSLSLTENGRRVTLTPDGVLNSNEIYQALLGGGDGLFDLAGNNLRQASTRFTTGDSLSIQAPGIVATNLDGDTTAVALNAPIRLKLDQVVSEVCVTGDTILLSDGFANVAAATSLSTDSQLITFDPDVDLTASTGYSLTVDGVCNVSGQAQSGYSLNFTTGLDVDVGRPFPMSATPANGSADIPLDTIFTVEFNEVLDPIWFAERVSLNGIRVFDSSSIAIPGDWVLSGNTATFTPAGPLTPGQRVFIRIDRSALKDQVGNVSSSITQYFFDTATM